MVDSKGIDLNLIALSSQHARDKTIHGMRAADERCKVKKKSTSGSAIH